MAKFAEARSRLVAALLSDEPVAEMVLALAKSAREDKSLTAKQRLELAVLADQNRRKSQHFASKEDYWAAREASARQMMADFPELTAPHSHLVAVAEGLPREASLDLAQEIVASAAPADVKARAQDLVVRGMMDGQKIAAMLADVPGAAGLLRRAAGRPLVFYTWSPQDRASIARAKDLGMRFPKEALVIAVNLGRDVSDALATAADQELPGEQLYGARGFDSPLVRALALTKPGLVYAVAANGELRNFSDMYDATELVAFLK